MLVASAPFLGQFRSALRRTFPDQFVWIVAGLIVLGAAGAAVLAARGIRDRRGPRLTLIAVSLLTAAAYAWDNAGARPDATAVELFHFVQYGAVTLLFYRACVGLGDAGALLVPVFAGAIVGMAEEWFQWFLPGRVGEVRDLYLNLAAIGCGMLFSLAVYPPSGLVRGMGPASSRLAARAAAAAILSLAAFIHVIHLGHRIADDEAGLFDSRFTASRLAELSAERRARWAVEPPPARVRRVSREDQYLTEAAQHAQERNELWAAGDVQGAWAENRILEKHYAPVLDVTWYDAPSGIRWPEAQRADAAVRAAEARAANPARLYVSDAYPYPIFRWHAALVWTVALVSAALILLIGAWAGRRPATEMGPQHV